MKRILALLVAMVMTLGCVGITAMAEETASVVAKIGTTEYTSFDEAITAANAMTGDVTVEIYGKVEYTDSTANLTGAYDSISFVGKTEDAEISITRDGSGGYISGSTAGNDCTVNFTDLILSKPTGAYANDAGFMNVYFTVYRVGAVNYTNCVFPDGACAQGCDVKYNYCEFANQTSGEYSLWVYANTTTTVTNSKFTGVRGVKMYGEGASKTGNLVMSDTVFTESVTQKPAIVLTYGESVTLEGNTYPTKGVFELDLDGSPDGTTVTAGTTTNITCINDSGACGVLVDGKIYTTVAAAVAVATTGSTVTLLHNSTETVTLPEGVILDKNGYTAENVTVKVTAVAQIGDTTYATLAEAVAAAKSGDEILLLTNVEGGINIPADVTFNGNGFAVNGTLMALGDITFAGHTKITKFDFENVGTEINIGVGACLEITGTGRMVIGHGCTFNIDGNITDAKTANTASITPSLIAPGASFTGAGLNFNVTNAYVKFTAYCSSKNSNASGTYNFNVNNSVWEQSGSLVFSVPTSGMDPTFNFNLKDSVLNSTSHLVFAVTKGEIVIDNSNVNNDNAKQLENRSNLTIKNGSVVYAAVATSENAKNPGTLIVDNATYNATGEFSGSDVGVGSLILKNGATANVTTISKDKATVTLGAGCALTCNTEDLAITTDDGYEVKYENGVYTAVKAPVAYIGEQGYETVQAAINAATDGETVTICAGEYSAINISNKNITIQGTVGDSGELLTTIKGGNPAITGHSFNGTIKDIKIVDAWKVMYAEPAGNVTVDNVYVTGATYGFHLVAYSSGLTWKIENSYMDLAWANSFGVSGDGYADIIIRGNEFVSTNPYYSDYGAIHVNSFLPSVTVEENIFGENARIYIDGSVTDTSKVKISKNYHADGVENAFADDAEGVKVEIDSYYKTVDENGNLTDLIIIPKGNIQVGYFTTNYNNGGRHGIYGEAVNVVGTESFKVELYSGDTLVGTAELVDTQKVLLNGVSKKISWHILLGDDTDTWWNNNWVGGAMNVNALPDKVVLYVDGKKVSEGAVKLNSADNSYPIMAVVSDANGNVHSFIAADGYVGNLKNVAEKLSAGIAAASSGDTVTLLTDITYKEGKQEIHVPAGVTIDGNGKTVTINDVANNSSVSAFYSEGSYTVKNLTITTPNDVAAGAQAISMVHGGTAENVTVTGKFPTGIFAGSNTTVTGCTFNNASIYTTYGVDMSGMSDAVNVVISNNIFDSNRAALLYGSVEFTGNTATANCAKGVSVYSDGKVVITNNTFNGTRALSLTAIGEADISENVITGCVETVTSAELSANYWGGNAPAETQIVIEDETAEVTVDSYYTTLNTDGTLADLVSAKAVAEVNGVKYATLQEALDAAAAGTGNVTVEILENIDLTNVDWTPVTVSAPGYPVVTVNGNDKTITGLNDMLFAGTWAGNSGLIINDLTIADSNIVNDKDDTKGTVGVGAFIGYPQASETITLNNCHLVNSTVEGGHWTGGLIGMAGGYNGNDGPVFMNLTITGCSVTGSTITGKGSAGGVIGHGSCAAWTNVVIENTTVSGNTITSTGSSTNKAGAVMGTIGAAGQSTTAAGETKTGGASVSATVSDNTVTSNGTTITTIYGRQGTETGMLYVAGGTYENNPIEENVTYAQPAEGYEIVQNEDGTYGVQEKSEEAAALNTKVFFLYNRTPMEAPAAIQEKYGEGNYYRVRLYAAIDGLDYSELGFKVAIDNGVNTPASAVFALENKVVYDTIKVTTDDGTTTLKPEQFNHTEDFNAKYLYALNVWVHENWGPETKLSVTPYAKDLNLKEFNGLVWGSDVIGTVQE